MFDEAYSPASEASVRARKLNLTAALYILDRRPASLAAGPRLRNFDWGGESMGTPSHQGGGGDRWARLQSEI